MTPLARFDAVLPAFLAASICVAAACSGPAAGTDVTGSSAKPLATNAPTAAPSTGVLHPAPATTNAATVGALEVPEKGNVTYTIELPPGLINVSGDKLVASYAKSETDDVGPVIRVRPDVGPRMTLDDALAAAKKDGREVLESEKIGAGWLVATVDAKAKVVAVQRLVEGAPGVLCNAFSKGDEALAAKDKTLEALVSACRSVAIKTS